MLIITFYILFITVLWLSIPSKMLEHRYLIIISGFLLFLVSALRNFDFSADTIQYVNKYVALSFIEISDLWSDFINLEGKDPFFYFVSKLISIMGADYQVWIAIIALIFCFSISWLIYKYSSNGYLSFILLISLGYLFFSMTGLRQTVALSILLFSYSYMREKRFLPFAFFVLMGSLFHLTAIVFLLAYPLAYMKVGWRQISGIGTALLFSYFFNEPILRIISFIGKKDERFSNYEYSNATLSLTGFIIQLLIYIFCLYYKKEVLTDDKRNLTLYNLLFLGLVFQAFAGLIAESFRVSMYFSIFSIILIPIAISYEKNKWKKSIIYLFIIGALVGYIYWTSSFKGLEFMFWNYKIFHY